MKTDIWMVRGPRVSGFTFFPADQQKNKEHSDVRFNQVSPLIMASQDLPVRFDSLAKKGISFISYPVKWMGKADQPMQANLTKKAWDCFSFIHLLKAIKLGEYNRSLLNNIENS